MTPTEQEELDRAFHKLVERHIRMRKGGGMSKTSAEQLKDFREIQQQTEVYAEELIRKGQYETLKQWIVSLNQLVESYQCLVRDIPACPAHGDLCTAHAREWIHAHRAQDLGRVEPAQQFWTCTDFRGYGHGPGGTAAVVHAATAEEAERLLRESFAQKAIPVRAWETLTLQPLQTVHAVTILHDGDY